MTFYDINNTNKPYLTCLSTPHPHSATNPVDSDGPSKRQTGDTVRPAPKYAVYLPIYRVRPRSRSRRRRHPPANQAGHDDDLGPVEEGEKQKTKKSPQAATEPTARAPPRPLIYGRMACHGQPE